MLKYSDDFKKKLLEKINKWYEKNKKDFDKMHGDLDLLSLELENVKKMIDTKEVKASIERICQASKDPWGDKKVLKEIPLMSEYYVATWTPNKKYLDITDYKKFKEDAFNYANKKLDKGEHLHNLSRVLKEFVFGQKYFDKKSLNSNIKKVIDLMKKEKIDSEIASPNYVSDFAKNRGITLTSEEVVEISNNYEIKKTAAGSEVLKFTTKTPGDISVKVISKITKIPEKEIVAVSTKEVNISWEAQLIFGSAGISYISVIAPNQKIYMNVELENGELESLDLELKNIEILINTLDGPELLYPTQLSWYDKNPVLEFN